MRLYIGRAGARLEPWLERATHLTWSHSMTGTIWIAANILLQGSQFSVMSASNADRCAVVNTAFTPCLSIAPFTTSLTTPRKKSAALLEIRGSMRCLMLVFQGGERKGKESLMMR